MFKTLGAQYLWAYLKATNYKPKTKITDGDFKLFGIKLRLELTVTDKTIKRYVTEAWKATKAAGIAPTYPKPAGLFSVLYGIGRPEGRKTKFRPDYCSIKWSYKHGSIR